MEKRLVRDLYFNNRWYFSIAGTALLFCISFFVPVLLTIATIVLLTLTTFTILDYLLLFGGKGTIMAERLTANRFSLGDNNTVTLFINNSYRFNVSLLIIDELPEQFQDRDFTLRLNIKYKRKNETTYTLKPLTRGEYNFGYLLCFAKSPLGLLQIKCRAAEPSSVKVYPSYLQLKKYQLLGMSDNITFGAKKVRRLGHSLEFEKIKDYVPGDDVRTINWKATARTGNMMVNTYTDTRQQLVYCVIDKGRAMKMPFEGMSLLDYAINASLVISNVVLLRHDKAGLITFANKVNDIVAAERRTNQLNLIVETLYKQHTDFKESDYEGLWTKIHRNITQRSLLLFFTNFETYSSLERQLPYLSQMATRHLVCVIFFQNTLLKQIYETQPDSIEGIYIKTVAGQFDFEKRQIVKELRKHGILSILTTPQNLTIDVINKYLELKARQMI